MTEPIKANVPVNPLDTLFGIEPEVDLNKAQAEDYVVTTEGEVAVLEGKEEVDPTAKDEEDVEIDNKLDNIHTAAMDAFNTQTAYMELIEPRYAARNAEVAANYLNIALSAVNSRAKVKTERVKTKAFIPYNNGSGSKLAGQTVTATREEIMRMLGDD